MSTPDRLTDEEREDLAGRLRRRGFVGFRALADVMDEVDTTLAARLAAQPPEPAPCANCSGPDDPHPPAWECSGCGAHVDVMPTKAVAQPPPTDRVDEATTAYTTVRWEVVRGSSTTGHQDKDRARADYEHRAKTLHRGETISLRRITTRERREQRTDVIAERARPAEAEPQGGAA